MDKSLRQELVEELNIIKKLMREAVIEGDVSQKERETIMTHVGAIKAVLRDQCDIPSMSRHFMRHSRM